MKTKHVLIVLLVVLVGGPLAYLIPQAVAGRNELNELTVKDMVTVSEDSDEFEFYSDATGLMHADHARFLYDYLMKQGFAVATSPPPMKEVLFKSELTSGGPTVVVNTDGSVYTYCAESIFKGEQFTPKWWHYWLVCKYPVFVVAASEEFASEVRTWWDDPK